MIWSALALTFALATSGPSRGTPDVVVLPELAQIERLQAHYAKVVAELESAAVPALAPAQRGERTRLIGVLRDFGACGEFGHNIDFTGSRMPYFRDAAGRRCAVAELMHASGENAFVEKVRSERNHVWICDLRGDPQFEGWLARSGFTIEEAGRIHGPPITGGGDTVGGGGSGGSPAGGSYIGPGDTAPSGGGTSGPSRPSTGGTSGGAKSGGSRGGPAAPSTPTGGGSAPGSNNAPHPVTLTMTTDDTWWLWWEYNKGQFLVPNRLTLANAPMSGDDAEGALRAAIVRARESMVPVFGKALSDPDANVRATAAIAMGRVGGGKSVAELLPLLGDPNVDVRHKAILALGATGTAEAVTPLLAIARYGALTAEGTTRISPQARQLAIVALGLGRRHDFDDRLDVEIAKLIQNRTGKDREAVGVAALIYQMLSPSAELERYALILAKDDTESPSVRCRAVESLRSGKDDKILSELQHFLSGPRLDLRRSAALALGDYQSSLALPALMTAFELESEQLTRGFILISIGKQGGHKAQGFLVDVLEKGESGMRRWAALALGIETRDVVDPELAAKLSTTLRAAALREKNQDSIGAYWLASGLARDEDARPAIRAGLVSSANPRQRMYAATALALLGGDPSLEVLRQRIEQENQALVRVAIAQSLGVMGRAPDAGPMMSMLMRLNEPFLQGLAASAMAAHGSLEALRALVELARLESGSNVRRAAAIEGLGMILAPHPPMAFGEVSREANYTVFADWVTGIFQTTL